MMFDPKASVDFIGNTGPFIQFNHVRASSVLRKCEAQGINLSVQNIDPESWDGDELRLIQMALAWPEIVQSAAQAYDPSLIANHSYELTKAYSRWYQDHGIINESDSGKQSARIALTQLFTAQVETAMGLLGVEMPARM